MKIALMFVGRRLNGQKLVYAFVDRENQEYFFKTVKNVYIGNHYEAEKKADGTTIRSMPQEIDPPQGLKENPSWIERYKLLDREARETVRVARLKRVTANSALVKGIADLLRPHIGVLNYGEMKQAIEFALDDALKADRQAKELKWEAAVKAIHRKYAKQKRVKAK